MTYNTFINPWCFVFNSGDGVASDSVVSAQIHPISKETYVFTLCQDYKIRVWSCQVLYYSTTLVCSCRNLYTTYSYPKNISETSK